MHLEPISYSSVAQPISTVFNLSPACHHTRARMLPWPRDARQLLLQGAMGGG